MDQAGGNPAYVFADEGCSYGRLHKPYGTNVRHVFTTQGGSGGTDVRNWGSSVQPLITDIAAQNGTHPSIDGHPGSYGITYKGGYVDGVTRQADYSVNLQGLYMRVIGVTVRGGNGFQSNEDNGLANLGCEAVDCLHIRDSASSKASFDVSAPYSQSEFKVTNPRVVQAAGDPLAFSATNGRLSVRSAIIDVKPSAATNRLIEVGANGIIDVDGMDVNLNSATGPNIAIAKAVADSNNVGGNVRVRALRVRGGNSNFQALANAGGVACKMSFRDVDLNIAPSTAAGVINGGSATLMEVGYEVDSARISTRAFFTLGVTGVMPGTTPRLDVTNRCHPVIFANLVATATATTIDNITPGDFVGQQLVIRNSKSSSKNLLLSATGTNMDVVATTLLPGQSQRLFWFGTAWGAG